MFLALNLAKAVCNMHLTFSKGTKKGCKKNEQGTKNEGNNNPFTLFTKGSDRVNNTNQQKRTKTSKFPKDQNNASLESFT